MIVWNNTALPCKAQSRPLHSTEHMCMGISRAFTPTGRATSRATGRIQARCRLDAGRAGSMGPLWHLLAAGLCSVGSYLYCCTGLREMASQKTQTSISKGEAGGKKDNFGRFQECTWSAACWDGGVKIRQLGGCSSRGWGKDQLNVLPDGPWMSK